MNGKVYLAAIIFTLGYLPIEIGVCLLLALLLWFHSFWLRHQLFLGVSLLLFLLSSFISPSIESASQIEPINHYQGTIHITNQPVQKEFYIEFEAELQDRQKILIRQENLTSGAHYGASCQAELLLETPTQATNPGQFDYQHFLSLQGINAIANEPTLYECHGSSTFSQLFHFRDHLLTHLDATLKPETSMWMKALVFGDREQFDDTIMNSFQFWNISHLLAISGLHVGFILGVLYGLLYFVFRTSKEMAMNIMLVCVPIYIVLAGSQPSVIRAGLMAVLLILTAKLKIKLDPIDIVAIVYILALVSDPYLLFQLSFQFSFLVTASLILSRRLFVQDNWFWISLKISLISQLVLLPLQFYHFYFTNVLSFLLNLLFVPYFTLFMIPFLLLILVFSIFENPFVSYLESLFLMINTPMMDALVGLEQFSIAQWLVGKPHLFIMIVYFILFYRMMQLWSRGMLKRASFCAIMLVGCFWIQQILPYLDTTYRITMLDVGQADTFVVELPRRSAVFLIDAGEEVNYSQMDQPNRNVENVIEPFLKSKGIQQIDALFISHFDYDHVAGAQTVIETFTPDHVFMAARENNDVMETYLPGLEPTELQKGHELTIKQATIEVMYPVHRASNGNENDHSLVFQLEYEQHRTLFLGDVERKGENDLIKQADIKPLDLLKVAHHGSSTSSSRELLDHLTMEEKEAFISVGENNSYGHPSAEVIDRLHHQLFRIWRTDRHGAVEMEYKNGQSTFTPFLP